MSRIHEALKRAEQARAASSEDRPSSPQAGEPGAIPDIAGANAAPLLADSPMPSFSAQLTFDALLARCPRSHWSPDTKTMLFFNADEQTRGTEEFRTLRTRLYQMRENQPLKKVLVTSSLAREGKSFVAANLAQALVRQHGRRALLIDADLRGPRLHLALGTSASPGMSEYLLGEADEFSILQRGPMENLFLIASGRSVSNPAELVANGRLRSLLNRLESLFDWIIVDSPPAVPVSDAGLLADCCDGVLMVVRANATPFDMARKAREEFGDKLLGVVLNGIEAGSAPYNEYYYRTYGKPNGQGEVQR